MIGLSAAIGGVKQTLTALKAESDAATNSLRLLTDTRRDLNQVARSSEDLAQMQERADRAAAQFGTGTPQEARAQARRVLTTTRREGFEGDFERLMRASRVIDVEAAAGAGGKINSQFGGRISEMGAIELMFATQKRADKSFEEIAKFMPTMAEATGLTGTSPEQTMAIGTVLMDRAARGKTAAGLGKSFALQMQADPRLRGKSMLEGMRIVEEEFTPAEQKPFLQSKETIEFFDIVREERARIDQLERELSTPGLAKSELEQAILRGQLDPNMRAEQQMTAAAIANEVSRERELGVKGAAAEAQIARVQTAVRESGGSQLEVMIVQKAAQTARNLGFSAEGVRMTAAGALGGVRAPDWEADNRRIGDDLQAASGDLRGAAADLRQSAGQNYTNRARREQSVPVE
jgi:hypothetical protein